MEGTGEAEWGNEKFCIRRCLSGSLAFGTKEIGEVWNGPIKDSSSSREKGPIYRPQLNSVVITLTKAEACCGAEVEFGGMNVMDKGWMPA